MGAFTEKATLDGRTVLDFGDAFLYLQKEKLERLVIVQVRKDGTLFDPYQLAYGQPNRVMFYVPEFAQYVKGIVEWGFVLLHNHPGASEFLPLPPSNQDQKLNTTVFTIAQKLGKRYYNHCVIAEKAYYMRDIQPHVFDV